MKHTQVLLVALLLAVGPMATADSGLRAAPQEPDGSAAAAPDRLPRAAELLAQGDLQGAAALLQEILAANPSSGEAHRLLARVRQEQGRIEEAHFERRAAYDAGIRDPEMLLLLGRDLVSRKAWGLATRVLMEADAAEPLPPGPRAGLALALAESGRHEEAIQQLSILLALAPDNHDLRMARARAELFLGQTQAALADAEVLVRETPGDVNAWLLKGKALTRASRYEESIETFQKLLSLDPHPSVRSIAQADIGSARGKMGDTEAAEEAYRQALATDPRNALAASNLAALVLDRGDAGEAELILRTALNHSPSASLLYYQLGRSLQASGRLDDAEGNLKEALRLDPGNPGYHNQLALILQQAGKTEEAESEMQVYKDLLQRRKRKLGSE
jgi:tetratricopeptide (TPR) repeat protein